MSTCQRHDGRSAATSSATTHSVRISHWEDEHPTASMRKKVRRMPLDQSRSRLDVVQPLGSTSAQHLGSKCGQRSLRAPTVSARDEMWPLVADSQLLLEFRDELKILLFLVGLLAYMLHEDTDNQVYQAMFQSPNFVHDYLEPAEAYTVIIPE
jgi:hypothetical protein